MAAHKAQSANFLDRHLGTVIFFGAMLLSQAGIFAVSQNKIAQVESRQQEMVTRSEHADVVRRIGALEVEVVPRQEHQLRDEQLNLRLKNIEEAVHSIDDRLNEMQRQFKR